MCLLRCAGLAGQGSRRRSRSRAGFPYTWPVPRQGLCAVAMGAWGHASTIAPPALVFSSSVSQYQGRHVRVLSGPKLAQGAGLGDWSAAAPNEARRTRHHQFRTHARWGWSCGEFDASWPGILSHITQLPLLHVDLYVLEVDNCAAADRRMARHYCSAANALPFVQHALFFYQNRLNKRRV